MKLSIFTYCYNPRTLEKLKINSPTLWVGSLNKNLNVKLDLKNFNRYKAKGFNPILMLDAVNHCGREFNINKSNLKNVKKWCKQLATVSNHIMLDIEPVVEKQIPLYKEIRKNYPHKISGCFGQIINKEILKHVDNSVYMFYDYSTDLKSYREGITKMLNKIIKNKKEFSIGIPIVSSFYEFEELRNKWNKRVIKSPYKIKDYTKTAVEILTKANVKNNKLFQGITWWGLLSEPMTRHNLYYYPYKVTFNPLSLLRELG